MKINAIAPASLLNRTFKSPLGGWWHVEGVQGEVLFMKAGNTAGRSTFDKVKHWPVFPTHQEVTARYPRLIALTRQVAMLTETEAAANLVGFITEGPWAITSEATAHYGGAMAVIKNAFKNRHKS